MISILRNLLLFTGLLILFSGCLFSTKDITNDESLRGGYNKGDIFIAQKDIVIRDSDYLIDSDVIIRAFNKGDSPQGYKGLLRRGNKVKIVQIFFRHHFDIGDQINPIAIVLDGEWQGQEVNMRLVSKPLKDVVTEDSRYQILTNNEKFFIKE